MMTCKKCNDFVSSQKRRCACSLVFRIERYIPDRTVCTNFRFDHETGEAELRDRDECLDIPFRHIVMQRSRKHESGMFWVAESDLADTEPWQSAIRAAQMKRFEHGAK